MTLNLPDYSSYGYQVIKSLGQNYQASRATYLASCLTSNQEAVVIKHFRFGRSDSSWIHYSSYEQEIKLLQQIDHPSIPHYLNSFETTDGFCLVQEYKPAPSLAETTQWTPADVIQIATAVLEVLTYLQQHSQPILHRDLKPENILVNPNDPTQIYLVDFGFARRVDENVAHSSFIKGTLGFMSPEQIFNRSLTTASDLYGLGATLFCLLSGTKSVNVGELIDDQFRFNLAQLPKLDSEFVKWLGKMVEPKAVNRYPNAASALADLKLIQSGRQTSSQPSTIAILCSLLFGLLSIPLFAFWTGQSTPPPAPDPEPPPSQPSFPPEPIAPPAQGDEIEIFRNLRFQALNFASTSSMRLTVSYGTFTAKGVIASSLKSIPSSQPYEISHLAFDPRRQQFYGLNLHQLMALDMKEQELSELKPQGLRSLSWPSGLTFDTNRDRLIVANTRNEFLYAYSPELQNWTKLGEIDSNVQALTFDPEEDMIYGIAQSFGAESIVAPVHLLMYNTNGALVKTTPLALPMSISDSEYGSAQTQLIVVGQYIVVLIYAPYYASQNAQAWRIYLVNPRTGRVVAPP
jgi:serine/threonine protein kinase